ncbi:UMP1-domain-containing protein [Mytilinidion resinicola]|uniref:UMP1-domain-containing protein n=1 Tax=Mytilinidion resinicola TaxID=574789 RepID=A0A6A6YX31_9PEZI|nr:UMP1-domain-containing protein [Mytilinidion resinicola]KAF2813492.1 UMP1-domain-containing protein [Mytilinidion resinicola]
MKPLIAVPATIALLYRAWSRNSLTPVGLVVAGTTAVIHAIHPWSVFFALLGVFFLSGTAVTKVKHDVKARLTHSSTGSPGGEGPRNHIQVLANSLVATVLIALHSYDILTGDRTRAFSLTDEGSCWGRANDVLVVGIVANYAATASDTFSSELGILSKSPPRLITAPWRVVPPGTNGGVTVTGLGAGLLGSFIVAATSTLLIPFCSTWSIADKAQYTAALTFAGFAGTLLDSLLGALFQASVVDVQSGKVVEGAGGRKVLVHSAGSLHIKQEAKLRSRGDAAAGIARTSALEGPPSASTRSKSRDASGEVALDDSHDSRRVEVGRDILDNNAVNLLMAALSLRFIPPHQNPTTTTPELGAPSAPGIHDTLRSRAALTTPKPTSASSSGSAGPVVLDSAHPLEARLTQWRATQDAVKMEGLRRTFGIAEPVRRGMELRIAGAGEWRPAVLGGASGVHSDILAGRDAEIGWEDVFVGNELREVPDFHSEMEARMKMNW